MQDPIVSGGEKPTSIVLVAGCVQVEKPMPGGGPGLVEVLEAKGLDMVRRDWSTLSKDTGNYVLQQILSGARAGRHACVRLAGGS